MPRSVAITPAQDDPAIGEVLEREVSWVVIDAAGAQRLHWDAVAYVMSQSPLLRPLGWLARLYGAVGLGKPTYRLIGDSRRGLGAATSRLLTPVATIPRLTPPTRVGLMLVIAFCFVWNVQHISGGFQPVPEGSSIASIMQKAGFTQRWQMFAPSPPVRDGFLIFEAHTEDGASLDIFPEGARVLSFETPDDVVGLFGGARHRAFALQSWMRGGEDRLMFLSRLARHRCALENADRNQGQKINSVTIHFLENETRSHFQEEVSLHRVGEVACNG